jgi:glycosyltransferase involved in cell wall biosynthesis
MKNVLEMDKSSKEERIEKAKQFVKRYSWVKMAKETFKIYESCNSIRPGK